MGIPSSRAALMWLGIALLTSFALASAPDEPETFENHWSKHKAYSTRVGATLKNAGANGVGEMTLAALDWLARHQEKDGHWSAQKFTERCSKSDSCTNADKDQPERPGWPSADVGVTALALLAFLGRGNTHLQAELPEYQSLIKKAATWLISCQEGDKEPASQGRICKSKEFESPQAFGHALATIALGELLIGTGDKDWLEKPVEEAVHYALRAQNSFGWKFAPGVDRSDTPISCWMMEAVFTGRTCARAGLIEIDEAAFEKSWDGMVRWMTRVTGSGGTVGFETPGDRGAELIDRKGGPSYSKRMKTNTAAALFIAKLGGLKRIEFRRKVTNPGSGKKMKTKRISTKYWTELVREHLPEWRMAGAPGELSRVSFYYWYYGAYSTFQAGGGAWRDFSGALRTTLQENQRKEGCERGSWDPLGEWGAAGGRVYTTALAALALEARYRYRRGKLR